VTSGKRGKPEKRPGIPLNGGCNQGDDVLIVQDDCFKGMVMGRFTKILAALYGCVGGFSWWVALMGMIGQPRTPLASIYGMVIGLPWTVFVGQPSAPENDIANLMTIGIGVVLNTSLIYWLGRKLSRPRPFRH